MKRIKAIASLIQPCDIVIDVGCDHCYLAIELLNTKTAKHIINVDINEKPLEQGIANLKKHNQLANTTNLVNNGLKDLQSKINYTNIDYVIIAGMGTRTIIDILANNKLKISNYIIQSNKDLYSLRKWLYLHRYKIIKEIIIFENKIYYPILVVKKKIEFKIFNNLQFRYGDYKKIDNLQIYYQYLNWLLSYETNKLKNIKVQPKAITKEIKRLEKRIKHATSTSTKNI